MAQKVNYVFGHVFMKLQADMHSGQALDKKLKISSKPLDYADALMRTITSGVWQGGTENPS